MAVNYHTRIVMYVAILSSRTTLVKISILHAEHLLGLSFTVCHQFISYVIFTQSLDYDICYNVPYKETIRKYSRWVSNHIIFLKSIYLFDSCFLENHRPTCTWSSCVGCWWASLELSQGPLPSSSVSPTNT